jgi:uncharacterized protein (DUF885 family)
VTPPTPEVPSADAAFVTLADAILDDTLERHPEWATTVGDHRYDDRLDDRGPGTLAGERAAIARQRADLDRIDAAALSPANQVDAEILRNRQAARLFELDELRQHEWNPLIANPATALYALLARDFAPLPERLRSLAGRLAGVPDALSTARHSLRSLPRVHVETAISQFTGLATLLATEVERAVSTTPSLRAEVEPAREAALAAIDEHREWLADRLATATADPRIGAAHFATKLAHSLDIPVSPDEILAGAEEHLELIEEQIAATAARIAGERPDSPGLVRQVLDRLAGDGPDNDTIVATCRAALAATQEFVAESDLITLFADPVEIIVMPEIHRGVSVAYCDPPGALERAPLPTFYSVAPTPESWPQERVTSFFREYNAHMVQNLTVHEAMPGHVVQLQHAARFQGPTRTRNAFWSGPFVEGWAVYAEELMVDRGYPGAAYADGLRMQQLKMQLRMTINAILDIRIHAHGMTEDEAMRLMTRRGHQEEGEAVGKWRRAQLTSAQLSTYFVGYTGVAGVVRDLRQANPAWSDRATHDAVLAHGSPPTRHLRTLLALAPTPSGAGMPETAPDRR